MDAERAVVERTVEPLSLDRLVELARDARVVLLGEATHGTREFYRIRAEVSLRLVADHGFSAIAVEADWPDAYRAGRWARGRSEDASASDALGDFRRFPTWMWRNTEVVALLEGLRELNDSHRRDVGLYGIDLYSLYRSADEVVRYLDGLDADAAARARDRYGCFEFARSDESSYAHAAAFGAGTDCEDEVTAQLVELRRAAADYANRDGYIAEDEYFYAEQNARLVANAEEYYRTMFRGRVASWNLRDRHMTDTLAALADHVGRRTGEPARIVVWAHNSHVGDARATELGADGEWNVGQLARERWGRDVFSLGFTTSTGTVTAASAWGGPAERKRVRAPLDGSWERLFSEVGPEAFVLDLREPGVRAALSVPRLERAIGVLYVPSSERASHYFTASLADQFDAVVHVEETSALEPLERSAGWERGELPETYPSTV